MLLARKGVHKVLHAWDRPDFRHIFYSTEADSVRIKQAEQRFN